MALTDTEIRNSKPSDKTKYLFDNAGLYLQLNPNGSRWWRFKYRYEGKPKLLSLGVYPLITLKDARLAHTKARKLITEGVDPSAVRKQIRAEKNKKQEIAKCIAEGIPPEGSFQAVASEWYEKRSRTWVRHHAEDVMRRLGVNIFPFLGLRPIAEIEPCELLATIREIESRGAYDLSHRVLGVCGQVFRYGVATGQCRSDPTRDLKGALTPHKKKKQAAVRPEELPNLLRAIAQYDKTGDLQTRLALQLLAHTFVRTNELIGSEWSEFNLDNALWTIPAERMKMKAEHLVPLSTQSLGILRQLKEMSGISRFVFPGRNPDKPMSNNTMLFALYRLGYKGRMTGHGFRAVASTILNEIGYNPDVIERQLAHCERNEVRGAYNRAEYLPDRKKMMQEWSDRLAAIETGKLTF